MRTCSIPDCKRKYLAKGYCSMHYQRFKLTGNPLYTRCGRNLELHKMGKTSEYRTWQMMKQRCYYKNDKAYKYYGGRGIKICDRWQNSFLAFLKDMGSKPFPKAQIDRIDNDGNYEPSNCRWVTHAENSHNRSNNKLSMSKVKKIRKMHMKGKSTHKTLSLLYGVHPGTIGRIINNKIWI